MKLNPFDAIEKLIIEHGSSVIQSKHIALLKDELAILKEKFSVLTNENETLKTENQNQKIIIDELKKKNQVYEQTKEKLSHNTSFKMQWGCLLFAGDNRLYCPSCFHTNGKKIETSRVDVHNRYCAVCKTKIPSG
jgi:regulator of replication initiation timing